MKLHWQNKESFESELDDKRIQKFLFEQGSLTYFIQNYCQGSFNIELITESWERPMVDEAELLSLSSIETTFIRKSFLRCDDQVLVFARTVIPEKTLTGKNLQLMKLGEKPLGNILFNNEATYRTDMRYAKIPVNCVLHEEATNGLIITSELWGRQSLFYIETQALLITELFLPAILECNKN